MSEVWDRTAARAKEDLAKRKAFQAYEKERATKQREMAKEFAAKMDKIRADTAVREKEYLKIHAEWEKNLGRTLRIL